MFKIGSFVGIPSYNMVGKILSFEKNIMIVKVSMKHTIEVDTLDTDVYHFSLEKFKELYNIVVGDEDLEHLIFSLETYLHKAVDIDLLYNNEVSPSMKAKMLKWKFKKDIVDILTKENMSIGDIFFFNRDKDNQKAIGNLFVSGLLNKSFNYDDRKLCIVGYNSYEIIYINKNNIIDSDGNIVYIKMPIEDSKPKAIIKLLELIENN